MIISLPKLDRTKSPNTLLNHSFNLFLNTPAPLLYSVRLSIIANGHYYCSDVILALSLRHNFVKAKKSERDRINLKLCCFDLSMKSYENHDKPVIQKTPFLPSNDHFNIIWIETRNCDPKPFITFKITEEKSSLKIERPLKIILDFVKLKIGTRFIKKPFEEIDFPKANLKKSNVHVENSEFPENEAVNRNFDLFRSIFQCLSTVYTEWL